MFGREGGKRKKESPVQLSPSSAIKTGSAPSWLVSWSPYATQPIGPRSFLHSLLVVCKDKLALRVRDIGHLCFRRRDRVGPYLRVGYNLVARAVS